MGGRKSPTLAGAVVLRSHVVFPDLALPPVVRGPLARPAARRHTGRGGCLFKGTRSWLVAIPGMIGDLVPGPLNDWGVQLLKMGDFSLESQIPAEPPPPPPGIVSDHHEARTCPTAIKNSSHTGGSIRAPTEIELELQVTAVGLQPTAVGCNRRRSGSSPKQKKTPCPSGDVLRSTRTVVKCGQRPEQ